ncbi:hypothetical protein AB0C00_24800, partial [Micromonospora carbonacea]
MEPRAFFVAGRPAHGEGELTVTHPYDGRPVGRTTLATPDQVEAAVAAAAAARKSTGEPIATCPGADGGVSAATARTMAAASA